MLEYYKLIRNSIQLVDVELDHIMCRKLNGENQRIRVKFRRDVEVFTDSNKGESKLAEIYLNVTIDFEEDAPFELEVGYKGKCVPRKDISEGELAEYALDQVVPLLIPYARECIATTLARMGLPIFTLPTMDVLNSISENKE